MWPSPVPRPVGHGASGMTRLDDIIDDIIWGAVCVLLLLLGTAPYWAPYIGD